MKLKILLITDSKVRELEAMRFLRSELVRVLDARVTIVGSMADWERVYFLLRKILPDIVFMTQVQEDKCRELAAYIRESGAKVCVIPPETTLVKALENLIVNPKLTYNDLLDFLFLPGKAMADLFLKTDVDQRKVFITGSPKIDSLIKATGEVFYTKEQFEDLMHLRRGKKNIFIFTGFRGYSRDYIKSDSAFTGVTEIANEESDFIDLSLIRYLEMLPKLCRAFPECNFILKPHPLEDREVYSNITNSNFYLLNPGINLQNCLNSIDLAIHWNSTIAAECWLHGLKTLQYSPEKNYNYLLSELSGGNPLYTDLNEFLSGLTKYLQISLDRKYLNFQSTYLSENYGSLKPDASAKIATIIKNESKDHTSKVNFKPHYRQTVYVMMLLEMILGVRISRWLMHFVIPNYKWMYSTQNYVNE